MGDFNKILKSLRISKGLTQDELSKVLKVSRSTVGMYEKGDREPDYETLESIADYFNVSIDYLLGREKTTVRLINPITTIAAHFDGTEYTEEQLNRIKAFAAFIKTEEKKIIGGIILNKYEELLQDASDDNVRVYESFDLNGDNEVIEKIDGLYIDGHIALDKGLRTTAEKACVLAEELGHHYTSHGNMIDMNNLYNRKQERQARLQGYNRMIGLCGIVSAFKAGCQNRYEVAEHLHVTEEYLQEAIDCYTGKYGEYATLDNYIIYFIPYLGVMEMI